MLPERGGKQQQHPAQPESVRRTGCQQPGSERSVARASSQTDGKREKLPGPHVMVAGCHKATVLLLRQAPTSSMIINSPLPSDGATRRHNRLGLGNSTEM